MKRFVVTIGLLFSISSFAGHNFYLDVTTDKDVYQVGESALVNIRLKRKPENEEYEFTTVSKLDSLEIETISISSDHSYITTSELTEGEHFLVTDLFVQNANLAHELKQAIEFYKSQIEALNSEIAVEDDPVRLAELQEKLAQSESLLTTVQNELVSIRKPVGQSLTTVLTVNP